MHLEAKLFIESIKKSYPTFFVDKRVVDIGAGDINGNNRYLFENCDYVGVDVTENENVKLVCKAKDIPEDIGMFDTVISSECFEHDFDIYYSLHRILKLVKENGLFVFTCASTGRPEHGTKRTLPADSLSSNLKPSKEWYPNYYQNLTFDDICKIIPIQQYFTTCSFINNQNSKDLYFCGIRNGNNNFNELSQFRKIFESHNI